MDSIEFESKDTSPSAFQCLQIAKHEALGAAQNKNFVFSPWSIQLALSLLANGSKGLTKQELLTFLEAEYLHQLNSGNQQLLDSLIERPSEGRPVVTFVGGIWVDQSMKLNPYFASIAAYVYNVAAERVDFQDTTKHKKVIERVNKWAEQSTNGFIKSILPGDSFPPMTRILLGNALYFKGRWSSQFMKSSTKNHKFYLLNGDSVNVPFMSDEGQKFLHVSEDFKILKLAYKMSRISMYIILPNMREGLLPLLEKISSDPNFINGHPVEKQKVGKFRIPKFKINYNFELSDILRSLGLKSCFSDEAEFDEMVVNFKDGDLLKGCQLVHKSRIEIDEEGTEAAAISNVIVCGCAPPRVSPIVDFVADHPFIFMVRDCSSEMVLFMGHVVNPFLE